MKMTLSALFFELIGREYISGYQIFGLSQMDPYDGRFLIKYKDNEEDIAEPVR